MDKAQLLKIAEEGSEKYNAGQLDLLRTFAGIDCGTGDVEGNEKVVRIVTDFLTGFGAEVEHVTYPGVGTHVIGRIRPCVMQSGPVTENRAKPGNTDKAGGKIIINCHLDTVFHPGDTAKHPFRIEGDWAYGLGVADCKGGFVTSAAAVRIMKEAGLLPNKEIVMIYSCDEETGSHTGREVFAREAKGADCAFVFEPARNKNGIITRRKGEAFVTLTAAGKEAHAALAYKDGASATLEIAHKILRMQEMEDEDAGIHYNVGKMSGSVSSLVVAKDASCEASVSLQSPDSLGRVKADMKLLEEDIRVPGCKVTSSIDLLFPTQERTEGNVKLYELVRDAGKMMDLLLPEESSAGPSDACWFSTFGVPTVDALGPYMKDIHTVNERMYLPSLKERTKLFCLVLAIYALTKA